MASAATSASIRSSFGSWPWVGLLLGGATLVAYVAAMILVPAEPEGGGPAATRARGPLSAGAVALILIVLFFTWPILLGGGLLAAGIAIPVAILALAGLLTWWLVSGRDAERERRGRGAPQRPRDRRAGCRVFCLVFFAGAWAAAAGGGSGWPPGSLSPRAWRS